MMDKTTTVSLPLLPIGIFLVLLKTLGIADISWTFALAPIWIIPALFLSIWVVWIALGCLGILCGLGGVLIQGIEDWRTTRFNQTCNEMRQRREREARPVPIEMLPEVLEELPPESTRDEEEQRENLL